MNVNEIKKKVLAAIDAAAPRLVELSHQIHENPELLFEEKKAAALLTSELERQGFAVTRGSAGLETAFRAEFAGGSPGPTIAFLAEYDALAGLGHACGHNIIGTSALGAGIGLAAVMSELKGTAVVFGTPAEEGGGGKIIMVDKGEFKDIDAAMIVHPGSLTKVEAKALAALPLTVRFKGKPAHSAGSPHQGINALDALIQTFNNVNALRQHLKSDVRIHGFISKGGVAANIVPDFAEGRFIVRAADKKYHEQVVEKFKDCARAGALATGATVEFETAGLVYDPMKSNNTLEKAFLANLRSIGWDESAEPKTGMGSTDMGNVSQAVPSIHPSMAICDISVAGHSYEFREAARSERGDACVVAAAKAMALTAIDLLTDESLLKAAKEEFGRA
ncbi:MAG: M20 family metallopeptidase [Bacillota bacterium]|nr:M20 family metallopeptidase [Bacillota bacterium]